MATGRVTSSTGLKVSELKGKLTNLGLSTQGTKDILKDRLDNFLDAESIREEYMSIENPPNETAMADEIASPAELTVPVDQFASDADGSLVINSQDSEAFNIRAKLSSVCEDIELLKSNFESLKRSTDLPAKSGQVEALKRENVALNAKLKDVEAERDSLRLALTYLAKDLAALNYNQDTIEKRNQKPQETTKKAHQNTKDAPWELVEAKSKYKSKQRNANKKNKGKNKGSTEQKEASQPSSPSSQLNELSSSQPSESADRVTAVMGDSMVKYINGKRVSKSAGGKVYVKSFPGAKVNHMSHYVIPTLEELKPDEVILHVGTNDLRHEEPRTIAEGIVDIANQIIFKSPGTDITISEIITRGDDSSLDSKGKAVNKIVAQFCNQNSWKVLNHTNITKQELYKGLHLNKDGSSAFAKNLISHCSVGH